MSSVAAPAAVPRELFELKTADLPVATLLVHGADLAALRQALGQRLADTPNLFNHDPVVIDLSALPAGAVVDFAPLLALLREHRMQPVAVCGAGAEQLEAAQACGLSEAPELGAPRVQTVVREVVKEVEVVREVPTGQSATVVVDRPLRSGQQVYARGGDLIVLAAVNHGAEVIADGHIHVYAPLRGKAIAGNRGNVEARIFTTCLEPELIAIAGVYRTTDTPLPAEVAGKAAQVHLQGDKLVMEPLQELSFRS